MFVLAIAGQAGKTEIHRLSSWRWSVPIPIRGGKSSSKY